MVIVFIATILLKSQIYSNSKLNSKELYTILILADYKKQLRKGILRLSLI